MNLQTGDLLRLIPDIEIETVARCSGHVGTYAVVSGFHETSMKIDRPAANRIKQLEADHYCPDCPMAEPPIENSLKSERRRSASCAC